jgi:hypothetical protein
MLTRLIKTNNYLQTKEVDRKELEKLWKDKYTSRNNSIEISQH